MQTLPDIAEVESAFTAWRNVRGRRTEAIPDYLWQQVQALLPHYKPTLIASRLKLSGSQLKWLKTDFKKKDELSTQSDKQPEDGFAVATQPTLPQNNDLNRYTVTITGACKNMQLDLSLSALQLLIPSLLQQL